MLHGLKVAISGRGDKSLLATDQRLRDAEQTVSELQRWFPQLQVAIEENEKIWSSVGFSIRTVSRNMQEVYGKEHSMMYILDHLHAAGEQVVKPSRDHSLSADRAHAHGELRAFNERIRELRALQSECVASLKEKDYYHTKVETLRVNEGRKKKVTERDVDKRLRNEQKLSEVEGELRFQWERLQRELDEVVRSKEAVLDLVLWSFVQTQQYFFGRNPMGPVESLLGSRRGSPTGIRDVGPNFTGSLPDVCRTASAPPPEVCHAASAPPPEVPRCTLQPPPRAPSPDGRTPPGGDVLERLGTSLYPQI